MEQPCNGQVTYRNITFHVYLTEMFARSDLFEWCNFDHRDTSWLKRNGNSMEIWTCDARFALKIYTITVNESLPK